MGIDFDIWSLANSPITFSKIDLDDILYNIERKNMPV